MPWHWQGAVGGESARSGNNFNHPFLGKGATPVLWYNYPAGVAEQDAKRECPNLCPAERSSRECPSRKSGDGKAPIYRGVALRGLPKLVDILTDGLYPRPEPTGSHWLSPIARSISPITRHKCWSTYWGRLSIFRASWATSLACSVARQPD